MRTGSRPPELVLGPVLRPGDAGAVTVWVETSARATVEMLGCSAETFCVAGHHYALVDVDALSLDEPTPYEVLLDGHRVWPPEDTALPPTAVPSWRPGQAYRVAGGSCRQQGSLRRWPTRRSEVDGAEDDLGADALAALASELENGRRPPVHLLLLTGDQVYADEHHEAVVAMLRDRRGGPPAPGRPEVTTFEEYTWLYQRAWSHALVRWLLASVPSLMIFDDHDVIDDWNISQQWVDDMHLEPWWQDRLDAALMSYWVYQHLGNTTPQERADDPLYAQVVAVEDGAEILRAHMRRIGTGDTHRLDNSWSYHRQLGPVDVVVLDVRNGRVLDPDERSMLSPVDWSRLDEVIASDPDHLLVVTSVPWILPAHVHHLEAWVSRLVRSAGARVSRSAERIRRAIDLEHWAAFGTSHDDLAERLGRRPPDRPAIVLSGDVHMGYLARAGEPAGHALQVVASPLRQAEPWRERVGRRVAMAALTGRLTGALLARLSGHAGPAASIDTETWFTNHIATIQYGPDRVDVAIEAARVRDDRLALEPLVTERGEVS